MSMWTTWTRLPPTGRPSPNWGKVNVDTGDLTEVVRQVAELSRKVSCLTGRVTVLGNRLDGAGQGLIPAAHAFRLGLEIGAREGLGQAPQAAPRRRPRHLKVVR
jgi:hypothetical protein